MTDPAPAKPARTYRQPPLSLTIRVGSATRDTCDVDVFMASGTHCYLHRTIVTRYDSCDSIDALVEASLYQWVRYLLDREFQRRHSPNDADGRPGVLPPAWPGGLDVARRTALDQDSLPGI